MQSRPSIAEFENLTKKCEFLTEKNIQLRGLMSQLQTEIDLLRDDNTLLQQTNQEMVKRLQAMEDKECVSPTQPLSRQSSRTRVSRLSDNELRGCSESVSNDFKSFCADNYLHFDKAESPRFTTRVSLADRRFQQVKAVVKSIYTCGQKAINHGKNFYEQMLELRSQLSSASQSLNDSQEISLLLKYCSELVGQYGLIGNKFTFALERSFVEPLIIAYKSGLDPPKDLKKKYQRQSEEYEQLVSRIPSFNKDTPMTNYSNFLRNYFNETQEYEQARIDILEAYNLQLLKLNESLTGCLVESIAAVKKQFNDHREFIAELEDLCLFLDGCRLKKQQSHRALLMNAVNDLRANAPNETGNACDIEGYLFFRKQGSAFERRFFSVENHRLLRTEQEKLQLVKKQILPLELTNLKLSSQPYLNCFELESPGMRGSIIFIAQTEFHFKEWCFIIRKNIELKIGATKLADPRSLKEDAKKVDQLIADSVCADCGNANPSWVSTTFLVVVCLECSGYHRKLGGLSKIRSLKMDVIEPELMKRLQLYNNDNLNKILQGIVGESRKPTPNSQGKDKEAWIREKYLFRKYLDATLLEAYPEIKAELSGFIKQDALDK